MYLRYFLVIATVAAFSSLCCSKPENTTTAATESASSQAEPLATTPKEEGKAASTQDARLCSRWISGKEARTIVESGGLLLDVRTPEEYAAGHLEGAKNIPVDELAARMSEIDAATPVVVYCQSGKRAHRAATILADEDRTVSEIGHMGQYKPDAPAGCGD